MTPQTVNAYYNRSMNEVVFPAAILQPPFFDTAADDAVNYGAIGAVIGHEISHGFDDQGRRSDGEGNLRDWWSQEDASQFKARADRLVAQYGGSSPCPASRSTASSPSARTSATWGAHHRLPGLPALPGRRAAAGDRGVTGDSASSWAGRRSGGQVPRVGDAPPPGHRPARARRIPRERVLRNMPEFYAAFGVKEGDSMYLPADKRVKVW